MSGAMLRIPAGAAGDSGDVAVALEVAGALWDKGDNDEAIRWLKRAVEAASETGDAARAAELTRAASDLEGALESRREAATKTAFPTTAPPVPALPSEAPRVAGASRPPAVAPAPPPSAIPVSPPPAAAAVWGRDVRMRVAVKTSVRDPELLVLRPLADGQVPPAGTREGFLVLADDPRPTSNGGNGR